MIDSIFTSVIVGSYNQVRTLPLLLASLDRQTFTDFEILVADDGSSDGTAELCSEKRTFPLKFLSQPDLGFRKAKILNLALRSAKGAYLVFVDGDVILEKHFLQDHLMLRKAGQMVCGRRVDLSPRISEKISIQDVQGGRFDSMQWRIFRNWIAGETKNFKRGMRITQPWMRKVLGYEQPLDLLGSNFSVWKADLLEVNGFNEDFESYWGEDGDLYVRLRNAGKSILGAKSLCIQYHVFHQRRDPNPESVRRYEQLLTDTQYKWARHGYR